MIILLIVTHWLGDFVFQTDEMAKGKSKDNTTLLAHAVVYSSLLMMFAIGTNLVKRYFGEPTTIQVITFVVINFVAHFIVDYFTSRASAGIRQTKGECHDFYVMLGLDQAIHLIILVKTYQWLLQ